MVTRKALIWYLLVSLISLIVVNQWFPIDSNGGDEYAVDQEQSNSDNLPWLTCSDLNEVTKISVIGDGGVKIVWLAKWRDQLIVLSKLRNNIYLDDFNHNRLMLIKLSSSGKVVKLLGTCNETLIITQFHPFGNPLNLLIWNSQLFPPLIYRSIDCLKLCLQFVDLINFLHSHSDGPLVMCDSNSLSKLLSQFLLSIVDGNRDGDDSLTVNGLQLIVNDLDALPNVQRDKGIKCGSKQLIGIFVAPEQLWPYPGQPFNDTLMPTYNEKIDIWKIPDVCSWFIQFSPISLQLMNQLQPLHSQCKQINPELRPNASTVYQAYLKVYQRLLANSKWLQT